MSAVFVIVQHAEKLALPGDPGLTPLGRRQAEATAVALLHLQPAVLVSSPLRRAQETALPIAARCGLGFELDERLAERVNLDVGRDREEFFSDWTRSTDDRTFVPSGGRSSLATAEDMIGALRAHAVADGTGIVVSHGGATVDLLRTLLGDHELERRAPGLIQSSVPSCGLTTIAMTDDGWRVEPIAAVDHLTDHPHPTG